jgi:GntR family transcriptional regulator of abcA and norABC
MLYRDTADKIVVYIKEKKLTAGTKLPTYRAFADLFGVSLHTVGSAMERLHHKGIVRISPQSGVFVMEQAWQVLYPNAFDWHDYFDKINQVPLDLLLRFSESRRTDENKSRYVLSNMGISPDFGYLPMLENALKKTVTNLPYEKLVIPTEEHINKYKAAIAEHMRCYGIDLPDGSVLPAKGVYHSLLLIALTFFTPGFVCYYVSPSLLDVSGVFEMAGLRKTPLPSDKDGINLEYFSEAVKNGRKGFLVISPELDLSGARMGLERRRQLYHLCYSNLIPIVEIDEYRGYFSDWFPPIKALDKHGIVFYLASLSSVMHAFMDTGWIAATPELIERLAFMNISICSMPEIIPHNAQFEILSGDEYGRFLIGLQKELKERQKEFNALLDKQLGDIATWNRSLKVFLWVKFHDHIDVHKIAANNEGLTVSEYSRYAFADKNSVLINLASLSRGDMAEGIKLLSKVARKSLKD